MLLNKGFEEGSLEESLDISSGARTFVRGFGPPLYLYLLRSIESFVSSHDFQMTDS